MIYAFRRSWAVIPLIVGTPEKRSSWSPPFSAQVVTMGQFLVFFVSVTMTTQGISLQIQSVGTLQQSVQYRIGHGGLAQIFVPMIHRDLAGHQRGSLVHPVINDCQ